MAVILSAFLALACLSVFLPASARAYVLQGHPWPKNQTILMDLQLGSPGYTLQDGSTSWNQVAQASLDIWNPYLGDGISFKSETTSDSPAQHDGRNSVFFSGSVFGKSFGADTLAVTAYFYNSRTLQKDEADVVVNSAVKFDAYRGAQTNPSVFDLRRIVTHEFGHVLGLDHVPQDTVSIMTPYATDLDTIQQDDINGVEAMYGLPPALPVPVITSSLTASGNSQQIVQYTITASGFPTSYLATGLPGGLYCDSATGRITGYTQTGTYTITVGATNAAGTGTATLTLTLAGPPVVSGTLLYNLRLHDPFQYVPTIIGGATSFTVGKLPAGLALDPTTGVISGAPEEAGTFSPYYTASNSYGKGVNELVLEVTLLDPAVVTVSNFDYSTTTAAPKTLLQASDGNFYGATSSGGNVGDGAIFRLTPDGTVTVIHSLGYTEFSSPNGLGLIQASDGNLYASARSSVFRVALDGTVTQLHVYEKYLDGTGAALLQARDGNLYGSTAGGVFRLTLDGVYTVLRAFDSGLDGVNPSALIQASDGNFYGTTSSGGDGTAGDTSGNGTFFRLTSDGVLTTLHRFSANEGTPSGALVQGGDSDFYGTTADGGDNDDGTIFKMSSAGALTAVHSFTFTEGTHPTPLLLATDGNFYGAAYLGGDSGGDGFGSSGGKGTLFKLTSDGAFSTYHLFEPQAGCYPGGPLIQGSDGDLYGTTTSGGTYAFGSVFKRSLSGLPVTVTPTVTLEGTTQSVLVGSGGTAVFTVTLSAPQTTDMIVNYTVKGSAVNGTDYLTLKGTKKIKAGKTSKPIKVIPQGDLSGFAKKTVKITLIPGDGYTLGTAVTAKAKILAGQ